MLPFLHTHDYDHTHTHTRGLFQHAVSLHLSLSLPLSLDAHNVFNTLARTTRCKIDTEARLKEARGYWNSSLCLYMVMAFFGLIVDGAGAVAGDLVHAETLREIKVRAVSAPCVFFCVHVPAIGAPQLLVSAVTLTHTSGVAPCTSIARPIFERNSNSCCCALFLLLLGTVVVCANHQQSHRYAPRSLQPCT